MEESEAQEGVFHYGAEETPGPGRRWVGTPPKTRGHLFHELTDFIEGGIEFEPSAELEARYPDG